MFNSQPGSSRDPNFTSEPQPHPRVFTERTQTKSNENLPHNLVDSGVFDSQTGSSMDAGFTNEPQSSTSTNQSPLNKTQPSLSTPRDSGILDSEARPFQNQNYQIMKTKTKTFAKYLAKDVTYEVRVNTQ